jgi:hypothetical protein
VRGSERRIEPGRRTELDERIGVAFAPLQDDAEVVSNEGAVAAVPDDGAESRLRRVELAGRERSDPFGKARGQRWRQNLSRRRSG